jgi:hypothetical protein
MLKKEYSETFPIKKDPLVSSTQKKRFLKMSKLKKNIPEKLL